MTLPKEVGKPSAHMNLPWVARITPKRKKDEAGFTPLQISAGLIVLAILVALAVNQINNMFTRQKVDSTLTLLAEINQSAADLCPNGNYGGSGNGCDIDIGAIAKDGIAPAYTNQDKTEIIDPFNGQVTIAAATTEQSNDSLSITMPGVSQSACESLATKPVGDGTISVTVNGTAGAQAQMTAQEAEAACASTGGAQSYNFIYITKPGN
ncbi:type 4 pilus major pilin [Acetobacter malorum]|uniref:type 4 pilus major pilin n=1 Tax=Acetobacter malorum TaxID=178901 RepID=UPI00142D7CDB|nr:type 4 pilus major pilin [Acetobacter malorum]